MIHLVVHPAFKMKYFATRNWPESWVENARTLICNRYEVDYEGKYNLALDDIPAITPSRPSTPFSVCVSRLFMDTILLQVNTYLRKLAPISSTTLTSWI